MNRTRLFAGLVLLVPFVTAICVFLLIDLPTAASPLHALARESRRSLALEVGNACFVGTAAICVAMARRQLKRVAFLQLMLLSIGVVYGVAAAMEHRQRYRARPNILLLTPDGFDADRMSTYGNPHAVTPFLDALFRNGTIGASTYPVACCTPSGVLALLTGRIPLDTGVVYRNHQLRNIDEFKGLPTLLKFEGYYNLQLSEHYYSDSNLRHLRSFDQVNGSYEPARFPNWLPRWTNRYVWAVAAVLHDLTGASAFDLTPLQLAKAGPWSVDEKLAALNDEFDKHDEPVFAHVHFLETHGPWFPVTHHVFSTGLQQNRPEMVEFYEDALHELDGKLGRFLSKLKTRRPIIIALASDHANGSRVDRRIPLAIVGPGVPQRTVLATAQPIDLAPTILDVLAIPRPTWQVGRSLVSRQPLVEERPVVSVQIQGAWVVDQQWEIAPLAQNGGIGKVNMVICDTMLSLNLNNGKYGSRELRSGGKRCTRPSIEALLAFLKPFPFRPLAPPSAADPSLP